MDDPFSTPQRSSIRDFVSISKAAFIGLINELPFSELQIKSRFITEEEDIPTTSRFVQELGRALSSVNLTMSTSPSPKKMLHESLEHQHTTEQHASATIQPFPFVATASTGSVTTHRSITPEERKKWKTGEPSWTWQSISKVFFQRLTLY